MLLVTTPVIEGKTIQEYRGVVFGEVVNGINFVKDFTASFSNIFGGRATEYEQELVNSRADTINEMIKSYNGYDGEITVSSFPSTTLSTIDVKIGNLNVIDTP